VRGDPSYSRGSSKLSRIHGRNGVAYVAVTGPGGPTATGTAIASPMAFLSDWSINFTVNNYGLAVTVSSPTPTLPFPTVSGSITVRFSVTTALPRCNIGAAGIDGRTYKAGQYDPASGATLDTTTVTNGVHYFWAFAQYCDPVGGSAETGYSEVDRTAGVSFAANVQNGHTPTAGMTMTSTVGRSVRRALPR